MEKASIHQTFTAALDALVGEIKQDRSILAAILCGSLSHDTVWAKSDIDLVLVTIDDKKVERATDVALYADGVNVHAFLMPRAEFRKTVEGTGAQLLHALVSGQGPAALHARSRPSPICASGCTRSASATRSCSCCARRPRRCLPIYKAHKWFVTRGDLDYTALWILYAATPLAQIEVIGAPPARRSRGDPAGDDAEPGVLQDRLHRPAQRKEDAASRAGGARRGRRATSRIARRLLFAPVLEHLREVGEARSAHARSKTTSSATSTSSGVTTPANTSPTRA